MSEQPFKDLLSRFEHLLVRTEKESIDIYRVGKCGDTMVEFVTLNPGAEYPQHIHDRSSAGLHFLFGQGDIISGNERRPYRPGTSVFIHAGMPHGFDVRTPTLFVSLNTPAIVDHDGKIDLRYVERV